MGAACKKGEKKEVAEGPEERGTWASPAEFLLSCLGYAVGLGNVWRFPYLCYENGGGAFLIPYTIMLIFVGLPVFFIELTVGQYGAGGPMTVWSAAPLFQGIGAGMVVISIIGNIYYNMIIGWALYYMFASWQGTLPWTYCSNAFNTAFCYTNRESSDCENEGGWWFNQTCYNSTYLGDFNDTSECRSCNITEAVGDVESEEVCWNFTCNPMVEWLKDMADQRTTPSSEYFNRAMLDRSARIDDLGYIKWDLCLCLLLAWILCYLCVIKGIRSSGKVVYFTATFPYLILIILLIRGVLLPGAYEGIQFYIIPKWEKLLEPKVWVDAAGQIFFSLSVGMGGLMTFASYNKFSNNVWRDTLIVTFGNCLTSFFAGFAIFSILGYLAKSVGKNVEDVASSGSGLAFIAYPEVVTWLDPPQLWSTLFFFMLLTLGLDSQFAGIENVMTAIVDMIPRLRGHKPIVSLVLCILKFLLGLTMVTRAGLYWTDLMGYYSSGWSLVLIGLSECCVFSWVYGAKRLLKDLEDMIGFKFNVVHWWWWWTCWSVIAPLLIIVILVFNMIDFTPLSFGDYVLPEWAQGLGWLMAVAPVATIIIFAFINTWQSYKDPDFDGLTLGQRLARLCRPTAQWTANAEKFHAKRAAEAAKEGGSDNLGMIDMAETTNGKSGPPPAYTGAIDPAYNELSKPAYNGASNLAYVNDPNDPTRL